MLRILFLVLITTISLSSCKQDGGQAKATYPSLWEEKGIPAYTNGMITSDKHSGGTIGSNYVVVLETDDSFEDIYTWHKNTFAEQGWKVVKDVRREAGEASELILLVHTKGKLKHNVTVLKNFNEKQQIKTTVTYID